MFPGLAPWASLRHPSGIFAVVKCLAMKGGTEIVELIGSVIGPVFGTVPEKMRMLKQDSWMRKKRAVQSIPVETLPMGVHLMV